MCLECSVIQSLYNNSQAVPRALLLSLILILLDWNAEASLNSVASVAFCHRTSQTGRDIRTPVKQDDSVSLKNRTTMLEIFWLTEILDSKASWKEIHFYSYIFVVFVLFMSFTSRIYYYCWVKSLVIWSHFLLLYILVKIIGLLLYYLYLFYVAL